MTGIGAWADSFERARTLVANMSLQEKVSLTTGAASNNGCAGSIPAITRLGFPGMCLHDAGQGLRSTDFVNSYPSGIHVAASWNKPLAFRRGGSMGQEFKTKGVNVLLGPVVGPVGRVIKGGRNWEGFSIDPYLSGALVSETVRGVQAAGVITSTKHYIANEQETNRVPGGGVEAVSSNIDDKTMHELYLWPFQDAVKAGTGNIMCSYQRINNSYGCANSKTLNGLLKTELGFQGVVTSDWGAQHAGVATALSGMDMAMPNGGGFWGDELVKSVTNGSVPESRVTDMAVRIIASWYQMQQDEDFPPPGIGMPPNIAAPHTVVDARNVSARPVLLNGAAEGHVLVKNVNQTLPLRTPRMMSIFGYSAKAADLVNPTGFGLGSVLNFGGFPINPLEIADGFLGGRVAASSIATNGTMISGGGSGATSPANIVSPFEALKLQAYEDGTAVFWDLLSANPPVDPGSDVCLVFGNAWASESYDRPTVRDDYTDGLVKTVAGRCNNTIVVLHNAGIRLVDQWIDHPNVTAVIFAHLPGQDTGPALVSLLYGRINPSGKLPYTVARNESDYIALDPDRPLGKFRSFPQSDFHEGIYIDYRHFDARNITPRFEFGFGLSYTTFAYSDLVVQPATGANTGPYPTGQIDEGGQVDLWDVLVRVSARVTNTGNVDGAEVAQLYVGIPGAPARQLRGFDKPFVNASAEATVSFELTRRDLSVWDVVAQKWLLQSGTYNLWVGSSSRDLPLVSNVTITNRNGTAVI